MAAEAVSRMEWLATRTAAQVHSKDCFRYLKLFPKEYQLERSQDRTEPIALGAVVHAQEVLRPAGIWIPSSAIFAIHRARRDSCDVGRLQLRRRQHLLQPALAAGRSSNAATSVDLASSLSP